MGTITLHAPLGKGQTIFACHDAEKSNGTNRDARSPSLTVALPSQDANDGAPARMFKLVGREAWCLNELVKAGTSGITSLPYPGARLSHYVFKLRGHGIAIDTTTEKNAGAFAGKHGRYRLLSIVRIVESAGLDRVRP